MGWIVKRFMFSLFRVLKKKVLLLQKIILLLQNQAGLAITASPGSNLNANQHVWLKTPAFL